MPAASRGPRRGKPIDPASPRDPVRATWFGRGLMVLLPLALWLRWPLPEPGWSHFDEAAFVVLPLGFWGGDLNPHYFNYPALQFYLASVLYGAAYLLGWVGGQAADVRAFVAYHYLVEADDLLALARALSSAMSAATVVAVALLGRRLHGPLVGLLAAAFLAVSPLAVRFAHLAITDTPALLWIVLAVFIAVRARQRGRLSDALGAGLCVGLAAATKYPAALVALPVAAALWNPPAAGGRTVAAAAGASVLAFSLATPFAWLDAGVFWTHFSDMASTHLLSSADGARPAGAGLATAVRFGAGHLGALACAAVLTHSAWRRRWQDLVVLAWALAFALPLLVAGSTFLRYALPLAPLLALLLARVAVAAGRRPAVAATVLLLAGEPLYASARTWQLLSGVDTREQAKAWILAQMPEGGRLVEPALPCGRISLLTPADVFVRQAHFLRSYGPRRLQEAYRTLAGRANLPPLFVGRGEEAAAPRDDALHLAYRHPVCGEEAAGDAQAGLQRAAGAADQAAERPLRRGQPGVSENDPDRVFSPGSLEAGFDPGDWYFLPIGGFGGSGPSGPYIEATLPAAAIAPPPVTSQAFFDGMARILAAHQAGAAGRLPEALGLYQGFLVDWPAPEEVVGREVAARILTEAGALLTRSRQASTAIGYLERAVVLAADRADSRNELAVAYATDGYLERAVEIWKSVVAIDPAFAPAYHNLARALTRLGDPEAARAYQRLAERHASPDSP